MKIAFDLDGTLVREYTFFALELIKEEQLTSECLRLGVIRLCEELRKAGHELWVYTASFRSVETIEKLFRKYGLALDGVINYPIHADTLEAQESDFDGRHKYPPAFGINLLIDNLPEIAWEAEEWDFEALIIEETDEQWVEKVLEKVSKLEKNIK